MFLYFKFGAEKDMLDLLNNGTIYCNPLDYFARNDAHGRFDPDELVINVLTEWDGQTVIQSGSAGRIKVYSRQEKDTVLDPVGNLYCLYSLNIANVPFDSYHVFHQKMSDFGTHVIIIRNSSEFMRRLTAKLEISFSRNFIKYVSMRDFQGRKDFFTKDLAYRHQKEYCIHLHTGSERAFSFQLGSIEDIADIEQASNIKELSMDGDQLIFHLHHASKYMAR